MNIRRLCTFFGVCFVWAHLAKAQVLTTGKGITDQSFELDEVVVTGTGTQRLLKNTPVQTEVISRKELENFGGKSVEEILGGLTASFVFNEGDMGSQMKLNGLGNSYILVLVNGKRIHGDVGGENDLGLIDPHNIDKIEIVKGAQSALYGSDAMAGVINIITKKHDQDGLSIENTTRYGSFNDLRQHNGLGLMFGRLSSYTNFQLQHTDGWQNTAREYTEGKVVEDSRSMTVNKYTNWQIAQQFTYQASDKLDFYVDGTYYIKDINRPRNGRYPSCDVYTYDLHYNNASAAAGGQWKVNATDYVTFDVDWNKHAYFYKYTATTLQDGYDPQGNFTNYYPYFAGQKNLQSDQQRAMAQMKGVFYLPYENTLNTGFEFRYDYLDAPMRTAKGSADDWTAAVYVQDEFNLLSWLNVTAGLRLNQNRGFGFRATPKISTMLALGSWRLRLGYSQGFKTPTTKELHYRYLHTMGSSTFYNLGNEDLKAQSSDYLSAGLEYRGGAFTISATAYLNKLNNMIALVNVPLDHIPPGLTSGYGGDGSNAIIARQYMNMEDARTWGVDVNVSYKISPELQISGNYSYLDTKAHEYSSQKHRLVEVTIDGTAHHKWNASATWNHRFLDSYRMGVSLTTRGSSESFYQNNGNGKAYQIWRINTTHDLTKPGSKISWKMEAGIDNILGYKDRTMHPYHLGTTNAGRTFFVNLSLSFRHGKNLKPKKNINTKSDDDEN